MSVTESIISSMPDIKLIREGNKAEKINWQNGQEMIDQELESRYLDIAPELEHYEEYQQFDDALLSLVQ